MHKIMFVLSAVLATTAMADDDNWSNDSWTQSILGTVKKSQEFSAQEMDNERKYQLDQTSKMMKKNRNNPNWDSRDYPSTVDDMPTNGGSMSQGGKGQMMQDMNRQMQQMNKQMQRDMQRMNKQMQQDMGGMNQKY